MKKNKNAKLRVAHSEQNIKNGKKSTTLSTTKLP